MRHVARELAERAGLGPTFAQSRGCRGTPRGTWRRGFTLVETMVAIGALALVATGIAVIFETTGKTVSTGRRISAFNTYAAAIEQRLKADISSMTREGFLIIRNELADRNGDRLADPQDQPYQGPDTIPLYPGDTRARQRRIDELMFFAKGQFVSARDAIEPGVVARAEAARVYYGHGIKRVVNANPGSMYLRPDLNDINKDATARLGLEPAPAARAGNPNRYASDWILLRHVTLLCPPQTTLRPLPVNSAYVGYDDCEFQVALQPAAASVFRSLLNWPRPTQPPLAHPGFGNTALRPQFASGLVDIATTDLSEIRSHIMTCDIYPPTGAVDPLMYTPAQNSQPDTQNAGPDGQFRSAMHDPAVLDRIHTWMDEALPANSIYHVAGSPGANDAARIRCEGAPPDFAEVLRDPLLSAADREFIRTDQLMLASSNFLPRCTEFIVEWSFGKTYTTDSTIPAPVYDPQKAGQTVWHGMERWVVQNGQAAVNVAHPYDSVSAAAPIDAHYTPVPMRGGGTALWPATSLLIHRVVDVNAMSGSAAERSRPLTSYFGYVDPIFNPDMAPGAGDGKLDDPGDAAVATVPWPWPTMIRITMSLADPNDPAIERTYQFVFNVPQDGAQ